MQALTSLLVHEQFSSPKCMSAASYIHADATLETEDLPSDDDIISMVTGQDDADIEDSEEVNEEDSRDPVSTLKQALQAARSLQNYLDSTVGNEDDAWMILKLQEKLEKNSVQARVQTSLFDYFA